MQKAGPNLTTDTLAKAMEGMRVPSDIFGMPEMSWSASNHLASSESRLSQIQDSRWRLVLDYAQMK